MGSDVSCVVSLVVVVIVIGTDVEGLRLRTSRYRAVVTTVKLQTKRAIPA
jgi:hypothetical protein